MGSISTAQFLDSVLPKGIHYLGFTNGKLNASGRPLINCTVFSDGSEGVAKSSRYVKDDQDVYFALASFKEAKIYDEKNGYLKSYRHQENVARLKSIWLDIDFKNYDTPESCVAGVKDFLSNNIPAPTFLVNSGGGVHLYWAFEEELPVEKWTPLAQGLAGLAKQLGLRADFGVTIDSARVLRLPGTFNQKYEQKPECRVVGMGNYASIARMEELLLPHAAGQATAPARITAPSNVVNLFDPAANSDLSGGYEPSRKSSFETIAKECPTVADSLERRGAGDSYTLWKDLMHLAAFTEDGEDYIHDISDGYASYRPEETINAYEQSVTSKIEGRRGPTTCQRFSGSSTKCATCKYLGKIKSPWSLGVTQRVSESDPSFVVGEETFTTTYTMEEQPDGSILNVAKRVFVIGAALSDWHLIPCIGSEVGVALVVHVKMGSLERDVTIPMETTADARQLRVALVRDTVAVQEKELKLLQGVVVSWINHLRKKSTHADISTLGWTPDRKSFVLGNRIIGPLGDTPVSIAGAMSEDFNVVGSPDVWKKMATILCESAEPCFSYLLAAGFAAPLMSVGFASSLAISAYSSASGVGKSTAFKVIQSAWGDPTKMFSLDDTHNFLIGRAGIMNGLPLLWDEIRGDKAAQEITQTIFRLTQGKTKGRMTSTAEVRNTQKLNSLLLCATNTPIAEYIRRQVKQTEAGASRFLEFSMEIPNRGVDLEINRMTTKLESNYGHAGQEYIRFLVARSGQLESFVNKVEEQLLTEFTPGQAERFWFHGTAKIIAAALLLKKAGIVDIDAKRVKDFAFVVMNRQRGVVREQLRDDGEVVSDIANYYSSDTLVTKSFTGYKSGTRLPVESRPRGNNVLVHVGIAEGRVRVTNRAIEEFAFDHGLSVTHIREQIKRHHNGIPLRFTPGGGTDYAAGQARGWEFDARSSLGEGFTSAWTSSGPQAQGKPSQTDHLQP